MTPKPLTWLLIASVLLIFPGCFQGKPNGESRDGHLASAHGPAGKVNTGRSTKHIGAKHEHDDDLDDDDDLEDEFDGDSEHHDNDDDDHDELHQGRGEDSHAPAIVEHGKSHGAPHEAPNGSQHSASHEGGGGHDAHRHKLIVTSAVSQDITATRSYVCQIKSCKHIEVRALETGYLEAIPVKEGQYVQQGDLLFKILPPLYEAKMETEAAEVQLTQIEFDNAKKLFDQKVVSEQEVALSQAKLAKAQAQMRLSQAELGFTNVKAPFNGIINRLECQHGSLVSEGDVLTTLSDNSTMWVYFNVPESRYLEYMGSETEQNQELQVDLVLANHNKFDHHGKIGAIGADFNSETGNIAFRADFPNPKGLLRHGQTGKVQLSRIIHNAVVIPQRATFEILAKRYVFVVDENSTIQQKEIHINVEQDDIFVIGSGLNAGEQIVMEGIRQVKPGDKIEYEYRDPNIVLQELKNKAE